MMNDDDDLGFRAPQPELYGEEAGLGVAEGGSLWHNDEENNGFRRGLKMYAFLSFVCVF